MARHRKMEVAEDADPSMDISSLIDCCFLLLLYFIVCTSIGQERKLDMSMPGPPPPTNKINPLQPGVVKVDEKGVISWGQSGGEQMVIDTDMENHELPELVTQLESFKDKADSVGSTPIVQLTVDGTVPHQRVIDVLNAFAKGGIKQVGLTNMKDD